MSRRRTRKLRFPWSPRQQGFALLLAWCASLLLSVVHVDAPEHTEHVEPDCSGQFAQAAPPAPDITVPGITADCPSGEECPNPWHHHHDDRRHVDSQCASCSSLLERVSETPVHFEFVCTRVERVAPRTARLPPIAERLVVSLARGPPTSPSLLMDGTSGA